MSVDRPTLAAETIRIGSVVIRVTVSDSLVGRLLRDHYRSFVVEEEAHSVELRLAHPSHSHESFCVAKREVEATCRVTDGVFSVDSDLRTTPRAAVRLIRRVDRLDSWWLDRVQLLVRHGFEHPVMCVLDGRDGFLSLHAAALSTPSGVVLVLGPNNSGKTTTVVSLALHGFGLCMNDNFTPTNGKDALMFPGRHRFKGVAPSEPPPWMSPTSRPQMIRGCLFLREGHAARVTDVARAKELLTTYLETEREDHRDSKMFDCYKRLVRPSSLTSESEVVEHLASLPFVLFDWKHSSPEEAFELL